MQSDGTNQIFSPKDKYILKRSSVIREQDIFYLVGKSISSKCFMNKLTNYASRG